MKNKTDLRVIRTNANIRKAFYELMKEKAFIKITVQDIADKAFINRNTFYLHYLDKEDLLEQISNECFTKMRLKMDSFDAAVYRENVNEENLYELCYRSFTVLLEDIEFYEMIFVGDGLPHLISELTTMFRDHIETTGKEETKHVYAEFTSSALIGVMRYWIKNRDKYSVEEISTLLRDLYTKNIISFNRTH